MNKVLMSTGLACGILTVVFGWSGLTNDPDVNTMRGCEQEDEILYRPEFPGPWVCAALDDVVETVPTCQEDEVIYRVDDEGHLAFPEGRLACVHIEVFQ
jgi:hypothetical protein